MRVLKLTLENNLQELLAIQNNADNRLGKIIIEHKNVSQEQVEDILIEQYLRRKGLFLADPVNQVTVERRSLDVVTTSQDF